MHTQFIIFRKSTEVLTYFQEPSHFAQVNCAALFMDDNHYYAVLIYPSDVLTNLESLKDHIISDKAYLAHGDSQSTELITDRQYKLTLFPIIKLAETQEFYQHITDDIAQAFLQYYQMQLDEDFICEESKQLFVFSILPKETASVEGKKHPNERFPGFFQRLDKLSTEEIGKPIKLDFCVAYQPSSNERSPRH